MKVYVSGPISGYPNGNREAFSQAAQLLRKLGHDPVIPHDCPPHEHDGPCPVGYAQPHSVDYPAHTSTACFIRGDLRVLLECDAIYLITGWERSVGARLEFDVAAVSGLEIFYNDITLIGVSADAR